ncbi:unnamed protein product [Clonostachys rhizophaga]|uniref:Uncharacterized protein n=1 Tax=Clonostachys rhizophaga TaxID=160324 RepID=A0A9N9VU15_9HYPO|nr:unnamed protein product [Clonostachys rhizophaga]
MNMNPASSSDPLQISKTRVTKGEEPAEQQDCFTFEPTPERSPVPNQAPEANPIAPQRRKVPTRKLGRRRNNLPLVKLDRKNRRHNLPQDKLNHKNRRQNSPLDRLDRKNHRHNVLLDKLDRKKTRRQKIEWKKTLLLQQFSNELRIAKSDLETCQKQEQALRQSEAHAYAQAREFENALKTEKSMHTQAESQLSAARQEASTLRQAAVNAHAQAVQLEKALDDERHFHAETESKLSATQQDAEAFCQSAANAHAQAGQFEKVLNDERHFHTKTKSELSGARQEVTALRQDQVKARHDRNMMRKEMKEKQVILNEALEERDKAKEMAASTRQGQLKAISELNKAMRLNQGSDQSTDSQLVQKMVGLRNNIRDWSLTYFITESENLPRPSNQDMKNLDEIGLESVMRKDFLERSLQDSTIRPTVARSVLWGFLQRDVFRQYLWVMKPYSRWVRDTHQYLSSKMMTKYSQDSDEKSQKFNIWRANGSAMFSQAPRPGQKRVLRNRIITQLVTTTILLLKPLLASQDQKDAEDELYQIMDQALALDEELCRQVANLSVRYLENSLGLVGAHFNPQTMTTEIGSKDATAEDVVSVVLAPALVKRGNSAGNDFDKQIILVPMEVTCQPAEPKPAPRASPILVQTSTPSPGA